MHFQNGPPIVEDDKEAWALLQNWDLGLVIFRAMKANPHWSLEHAEQAAQCYRHFIWVFRKNTSSNMLTPHLSVDEIWHSHLLISKDYYMMCQRIIGHVVHHHPGDERVPSHEENQKFQRLYLETCARIQQLFGKDKDPRVLLAPYLRKEKPFFMLSKLQAILAILLK